MNKLIIMIILMIIELLDVIIGCYLACKYDCDNYLASEREQLKGAIGIFFLMMSTILLPLTFILALTLAY